MKRAVAAQRSLFSNLLETDLGHPYLNSQLIAYIGNKRSLLPFLHGVFSELLDGKPHAVFFDPFAGSGAVCRLAKAMGLSVAANEWEPYSEIINQCHIALDAGALGSLFKGRGGVRSVFEELNSLSDTGCEYIAKYFAPRDTHHADYRVERLFYTRENALFIDRVRERIESWYPERESPERAVLLASLLYQAATHANTNGVFKAYHRGFGGFGGDALSRIMKPMALQIPVLIDGADRCRVYREDAQRFVRRGVADVCYLDPPYNQHQYGSNYHLLNTIALWDKPEIGSDLGADGRLRRKAGIREDWVKTKSRFCYRSTANEAMHELLGAVDARYIALSYNTEGIIPFWELFEILAETGDVSIRTADYVLYRGGKQSLTRDTYNQEFLFILDRTTGVSGNARIAAERFLLERKVGILLRAVFSPDRVRERFEWSSDLLTYRFAGNREVRLRTRFGYELGEIVTDLTSLKDCELSELYEALLYCRVVDRQEEANILIDLLKPGLPSAESRRFQRQLVSVVKKYAFKKYRNQFSHTVARIREQLGNNHETYALLLEGLDSVEKIATLRFHG